MIARVTTWQTALDKLDEGIKSFKDNVIPAVKKQRGYKSGCLLVDRKTGKCMSIAYWDTEKNIIADEQSGAYQKRVDTGKNRWTVPPVRELYEVAI